MHILLLEDEPLVAISLIKLVKELEPAATLHGPVGGVRQAREWLASHPAPDLILADIQLSDGVSLDIFSTRFPHPMHTPPVIFTTAFNEYAIRAFKLNSIDYLLKPIGREELQAALQKFHVLQAKFSNEPWLKEIQALFRDFNQVKAFKERFTAHIGRTVAMIPLPEIAMFTKEEGIFLLDMDGKRYLTDYRSLDEVEELVNPAIFFRANRQCLAHLPALAGYRPDEWGKLALKWRKPQTDEIWVSKEKAAAFRQWFGG